MIKYILILCGMFGYSQCLSVKELTQKCNRYKHRWVTVRGQIESVSRDGTLMLVGSVRSFTNRYVIVVKNSGRRPYKYRGGRVKETHVNFKVRNCERDGLRYYTSN